MIFCFGSPSKLTLSLILPESQRIWVHCHVVSSLLAFLSFPKNSDGLNFCGFFWSLGLLSPNTSDEGAKSSCYMNSSLMMERKAVKYSSLRIDKLICRVHRVHHAKCRAGWSIAGIKIARRNIHNLRYADDTTLMAESEEELKSFDESERGEWKSWLKAQHSEN